MTNNKLSQEKPRCLGKSTGPESFKLFITTLKTKVNYCGIKETGMKSLVVQLFNPPLVVG